MTPPSDAAPASPWPWRLAALAMLVVVFACFHEGLTGRAAIDGSRLYTDDALYMRALPGPLPVSHSDASPTLAFQPWDALFLRGLKAGEPALWQPHNGFGQPLFANGQAGFFDPFKLILLGRDGVGDPLGRAWFLVAHLLFAMGGTLLLARRLGLSAAAGAIAALAFGLHGWLLTNMDFAQAHAAVMLPWLLWAGEGLLARPDRRAIALFGVLVGLTGLVGHAEPAIYAAGGAAAVVGVGALGRPERARIWAALAGGCALGVALAAVLLVPFVEFVRLCQSYLYAREASFMASASGFWRFPKAFAALGRHVFAPDIGPMTPYFNAYVGAVPACLALVGLGRSASARVGLVLLAVAALVIALCPPGNLVTLLAVAPNSFYVVPLVALGLGLLGAAGLDRLAARPGGLRWALAAVLALGFAGYAVLQQRRTPIYLLGHSGVGHLVFAAVAMFVAAALLIAWRRPAARPGVAVVLVALAAGDLVFAARTLVPPLPPFMYPVTPILAHLQAQPRGARVAGGGLALAPNTNAVHGIDHLGLLEAFFLMRYRLYDLALQPKRLMVSNLTVLEGGFRPELLDLAGVQFVVVAERPYRFPKLAASLREPVQRDPARFKPLVRQARATLYENTRALPRARVLYQAEYREPDARAASLRLAEAPARWREVALLETSQPAGWADAPLPPDPARIVARGMNHVTILATAARPGWLVLAEAYFPGWVATVDGVETPIVPADLAFRAVYLTPGTHTVAFRYRPRSVALGAAISLLALLLAAWLLRPAGWATKKRPLPEQGAG